ncbi:DUF2637 domain-containing protein [Nocardia sp. NPDC051981]|uniref:DUF2637 domain-containing protein n=1 Tax=Nocardia sp. NPDC051981 TaxID=3155417 RepID=UPI003423A009
MTATDTSPDPQHRVTADHPPAVSSAEDVDPTLCPSVPAGAQQDTGTARQDTPARAEDTPNRFQDTAEDTPGRNRPARDHVETAALIAVISVLTAASGWSAIALHGLAQAAGITSWLAWGAPVIVDGPLIQAAIALVVLKRREKDGATIEPGQRAFFWWMLAMSELVSLVGNGAHAWLLSPERTLKGWAAAIVAGAAPIAAMAVMHGLTILIEVLGQALKTTPRAGIAERTAPATDFEDFGALSPAVSSGHTTVSPGVSSPATGHTQDTAAVSSVHPGHSTGHIPDPAEDTAVSPEDRDATIWAMHSADASLRDIAAATGLSYGYVGKVVKRLKAERGDTDGDSDGPGATLHLIR